MPNTLFVLTKVPPSVACMSVKSNSPAIVGDLGVSGKDMSQWQSVAICFPFTSCRLIVKEGNHIRGIFPL